MEGVVGNRKRRASRVSDVSDTAKKSKKKDTNAQPKSSPAATEKAAFSVVEFIFRLRDPNTTFTAIEEFISCAEKFPIQSDYDIVKEFCCSSKDGSEILAVLDAGRRKPSEYQLIFTCLEHILTRIADDLAQYQSCGNAIVHHILERNTGSLYYQLAMRNKSSQIKSGLKLLTAMVMLSADSARDVLLQLQFSSSLSDMYALLYRRDIKDPQDVRTCVQLFVMAFLVVGDEALTRQLVEHKLLLQAVFKDMHMDKLEAIQAVLLTVLQQIVKNPAISKTLKVKLFNDQTLQHLCKVLSWKGPAKWHGTAKSQKHTSSSLTDEQIVITQGEEDQVIVKNLVTEVLTHLCCAPKTGVSFFDSSFGTSSRNVNPLLSTLLHNLSACFSEPGVQDLIINMLVTSPDQLEGYVKQMKSSLIPRLSPIFMERAQFLCRLYDHVARAPPVHKLPAHMEIATVLTIVQKLILPPVLEDLLQGLKHKSLAVCDSVLDVVLVVVRKAVWVRENWAETTDLAVRYTSAQRAWFMDSFMDMLTKSLPSCQLIMQTWQTVMSAPSTSQDKTQAGEHKDVPPGESEEVVHTVSELDVLVKLEEVVSLYLEIFPQAVTSEQIQVVSLLEGVLAVLTRQQAEQEPGVTEKIRQLQLNLLKILSNTDNQQVPWSKMTEDGRSMTLLLLDMMLQTGQDPHLSQQTLKLVTKLISGTGFFERSPDEILLWLKHLQKCPKTSVAYVLKFFAKILTTLLNNPYQYMDKVVDYFSEESFGEDVDTEVMRSGASDHIDAILKMEGIDDLVEKENNQSCDNTPSAGVETEDRGVMTERCMFSPLAVVAMETLDKDNEDCVHFVCGVLVELLHCQQDPVPLCRLIQQRADLLSSSPLLPYFMSWIPHPSQERRQSCEKLDLPTDMGSNLMRLYGNFQRLSTDTAFMKRLRHAMTELDTEAILVLVQQLTLYIRATITAINKKSKSRKSEITVYFHLLEDLIKKAVTITSGSESSAKQAEGQRKSSDADSSAILEQIVNVIFGDSMFQSYFLIVATSREKGNAIATSSTAPKLITLHISKIAKMLDLSAVPRARNKLNFYVSRILILLSECKSAGDKAEMFRDRSVMAAVDGFLSYFTVPALVKVTQSLLSGDHKSPQCSSAESSEFDQYKDFLTNILQRLCEQDSQDAQLPQCSVNKIFSYLPSMDTHQYQEICLCFVKQKPHYALAAKPAILEYLLQNTAVITSELSAKLVALNPALHKHFGKWLANASPLEYDKHLQPCLSWVLTSLATGDSSTSEEVKTLCVHFVPWVISLPSSHVPSDNSYKAVLWLSMLHTADQKFLKKVFTGLVRRVRERSLALCPVQLETLSLTCRCLNDDVAPDKHWQLILTCLHSFFMKESQKAMAKKIIDVLQNDLKLVNTDDLKTDELVQIWPSLVKLILKQHYTDGVALSLLSHLVSMLYSPGSDCLLTLLDLHQVIVNHSKFLPVLFDEEDKTVKDNLVSLLEKIVQLSPACCQASNMAVILGAYQATLSHTDQKLLKMLILHEKSGVDLSTFKPFMWGSKARQYYSMKTKGRSLTSHVSPGQILEMLDRDKMARSIYYFPLRRTLQMENVEEASDLKTEADSYDPCFLLTVLIQILGLENIVDCRQFVESRCLGYLFASLSSHDEAIRSMGYLALNLFHQHVEGSRFAGKDQVLYLMKTFRNSLKEPNMKLACVVMHFLDKALVTMCKPESHMFMVVNAFLLLKPDMNFLDVPEFYKLFNSSSLEYKQERGWMLELLTTGLRETSDYRIYQRRFVFKLLTTFYQSAVSDTWCKVQILKIFQAACREKTVASDLVRKEGFLTTLAGMVENSCGFPDRIPLLISVVDCLWTTMTRHRKRPPGASDPLRQGVLMLLRQIIHQFDEATPVDSASRCLSTLVSVLGERQDHGANAVSTLDMARLVAYCSTVSEDGAAAKRISQTMETAGFSGFSMKTSKQEKSKALAAEHSDVEMEGVEVSRCMSDFHSLLLRVTVRWLPSPEPECMLNRQWLETVAIICVAALKIFLSKPKASNDMMILLSWLKSWFDCGKDMAECLAREISDVPDKDKGHAVLTSLVDLYSTLYEPCGEWTECVIEDWRPWEITDNRQTLRLLNSVLISVAQLLPSWCTAEAPHLDRTQLADSDVGEDSMKLRKLLWELNMKTSSIL